MNLDLYIDEHPGSSPPEWGGGGSGGSGGGGGTGGSGGGSGSGGGGGGGVGGAWWGGTGGSGTDAPAWVYQDLSVTADYKSLRISAGGRLMQDDPRGLIYCGQLCPHIPPLLVYVRGDCEDSELQRHHRCVLIRLAYLDNCGRYLYEEAPVDVSGIETNASAAAEEIAYIGRFPLCEPEEQLALFARWQGGHYDHRLIREMRIVLFGVDLGWSKVPVDDWRQMAQITVDETFHIRVNGISAKLGGNKAKLYATH